LTSTKRTQSVVGALVADPVILVVTVTTAGRVGIVTIAPTVIFVTSAVRAIIVMTAVTVTVSPTVRTCNSLCTDNN